MKCCLEWQKHIEATKKKLHSDIFSLFCCRCLWSRSFELFYVERPANLFWSMSGEKKKHTESRWGGGMSQCTIIMYNILGRLKHLFPAQRVTPAMNNIFITIFLASLSSVPVPRAHLLQFIFQLIPVWVFTKFIYLKDKANFLSTLNPSVYCKLLPSGDLDTSVFFFYWTRSKN